MAKILKIGIFHNKLFPGAKKLKLKTLSKSFKMLCNNLTVAYFHNSQNFYAKKSEFWPIIFTRQQFLKIDNFWVPGAECPKIKSFKVLLNRLIFAYFHNSQDF